MLDATGKPGASGLLTGNVHALGSFDECLSIQVKDNPPQADGQLVPNFQGRYVMAMLGAQFSNPVMPTKTSTPAMINVFESYSQRNEMSKHIRFDFECLRPVTHYKSFFGFCIILEYSPWLQNDAKTRKHNVFQNQENQ